MDENSEFIDDTIFAVASGGGRAGVAVIRISGPDAGNAINALTGRIPPPRHASLARIIDPTHGNIIDRGIVLWFPGPGSFTGEDSAEFHVHGGRGVISALLKALGTIQGLRNAEAGEFSRRAFLNGRMDLTQVEGLADLIDSETEQQRRQAISQLGGVLGKETENWRLNLLQSLALIEAAIDFADEGDAPTQVIVPSTASVNSVASAIDRLLARGDSGERLREGLLVVIAGPPNAGKSTLLNVIAQRDAAIVSPFAGTTRDPMAVNLDIGGYPVQIVDTAGIRKARNSIEAQGIERAESYIDQADLVLWLSERPPKVAKGGKATQGEVWQVLSKIDKRSGDIRSGQHAISALSGKGVPELLQAIEAFVASKLGTGGAAIVTRERHRVALSQTSLHLAHFLATAATGNLEFLAEDLRLACRALGSIAGYVGVEEILGEIFSRFCIGK